MKLKMNVYAACLVMAVLSTLANAEILQGIKWNDTLGEVKERYPNAVFRSTKPAWLTPDQAFFTITGIGMSGVLRVVFDDGRPFYKRKLLEGAADPDFDKTGSIKRLSAQADDEALTVDWVRWSPDNPIPLDRYKKRYGEPTCSFDDSMSPVCKWSSVALEAQMSEDQKSVLFVTTNFTKAEKRSAYFEKYQFVPDFLK